MSDIDSQGSGEKVAEIRDTQLSELEVVKVTNSTDQKEGIQDLKTSEAEVRLQSEAAGGMKFAEIEEESKENALDQIEDEDDGNGEKANIGQNDSILFNAALLRDEDEEYKRIFVGHPKKQGDQILYEIKSFDNQGYFEVKRRFKDFIAFRETLVRRLPGLYIPSLPAKTFFEKNDMKTCEERSFHLEQFMKKVYKCPYLLESDELAVFARYQRSNEKEIDVVGKL